MDTDDKDINGDLLSGAETQAVAVTTTEIQDVAAQIIQAESCVNDVKSIKESVEILSVEFVKAATDVQYNKDNSAVSSVLDDKSNMMIIDQPEKENESSLKETVCAKNSVDYINNVGKEEVCVTLPEVNSSAPESIAIVDTCKESVKNSLDYINNLDKPEVFDTLPEVNSGSTDAIASVDTCKEFVKNSLDCINILDKKEVFDTLSEVNSGATDSIPSVNDCKASIENSAANMDKQEVLDTLPQVITVSTNSIASIGDTCCEVSLTNDVVNEYCEGQESTVYQSNMALGTVISDTSNNNMIEETIISPHIKSQSMEVSNISLSSEMDEVLEISSTSADNLPVKEAYDKNLTTLLIQDETEETNTTMNSITGLSLLAQYGSDIEDSDSDNDSVIEVATTNQDYRNRIVEIDSDSDSSSSGSDVEYLNKIRKTIEKRMEVDDDDDDDDHDDEGVAKTGNAQTGIRKKPKTKVKAKGEFQLEDLPPIQDLQITVPEDECIVLGKIHSIVDQLVLVSALPDSMLVDLETVLFLDKGQKVLGEVFDVLGQVADPLYCVRFNSNNQINEKNIQIDDVVYLAPKTPYTQYIILSSMMKHKGSDASWENDVEPPPRFLDYSDDEQQQQARREYRNKDRPVEHNDPQKRQRRDSEEPQVSSNSRPYNNSPQPRQRYPPSTRGGGGGGGPPNPGFYGRPPQQYNHHYRNPQIPQNHNPSSWHSNYYPQAYNPMPPSNAPYAAGYPRMPARAYPPIPMYPMGIGYPPPPPQHHHQHARTPNNHTLDHHLYMHNPFNMRPPTIPGHFDASTPPPGSQ